jgi:hypothetical protein
MFGHLMKLGETTNIYNLMNLYVTQTQVVELSQMLYM